MGTLGADKCVNHQLLEHTDTDPLLGMGSGRTNGSHPMGTMADNHRKARTGNSQARKINSQARKILRAWNISCGPCVGLPGSQGPPEQKIRKKETHLS